MQDPPNRCYIYCPLTPASSETVLGSDGQGGPVESSRAATLRHRQGTARLQNFPRTSRAHLRLSTRLLKLIVLRQKIIARCSRPRPLIISALIVSQTSLKTFPGPRLAIHLYVNSARIPLSLSSANFFPAGWYSITREPPAAPIAARGVNLENHYPQLFPGNALSTDP